MELGAAAMAGLVGVAGTMILHNLLPYIRLPRVNLAGLLGVWLLEPGRRAAIVGLLLHFAIGVGAAIAYAAIWASGIGRASVEWGVMFGAIHGLFAAIVIPLLLHRFPRPEEVDDDPPTIIAVFLLHVLFGLIVALQYRALV